MMHQPACTHISDDCPTLLCEKDTEDSQQDQDQEQTMHETPPAASTDTAGRLLPLWGSRCQKQHFCRSPIQGWQDQSHMAWHGKHNGEGQSHVQGVQRVPEMDSISLCQADNFACLPISLSCISQKRWYPFLFLSLLPGTSNQEQRMKEKCRGGMGGNEAGEGHLRVREQSLAERR